MYLFLMNLCIPFDSGAEEAGKGQSGQCIKLALEIATILLGAGFGAAIVLFAAPRGYLGHSRHRIASTSVTLSPTRSEQFSKTNTITPTLPTERIAPSPVPSAYETVQPKAVPPTPVPTSNAISFGGSNAISFSGSTSTKLQRYKRRSTPVRASSKTAVHKNKRR